MKICKDCRQIKPLTEFWKLGPKYLASYCKDCQRTRTAETMRKWRKEHKLSQEAQRLARYAITKEEYNFILVSQGNCCALCKAPFSNTKPNIDHNHRTGKVRGILCSSCNHRIILLDRPDGFLKAALAYCKD